MNTEILILILLFAAVIAYLFRITYVKGYKRGAKFQAEDFKKELDKQIKEHYKSNSQNITPKTKFVEVDFDGDPILEDKDESVIPKGTYTAAVDPIDKKPFDHFEAPINHLPKNSFYNALSEKEKYKLNYPIINRIEFDIKFIAINQHIWMSFKEYRNLHICDSTIAAAMGVNMEIRKKRMENIISTLPKNSWGK